jgi:hypothetical protein
VQSRRVPQQVDGFPQAWPGTLVGSGQQNAQHLLAMAFPMIARVQGNQSAVAVFQVRHAVPPVNRARRRCRAARVCARSFSTSTASRAAPGSVSR